MDDGKLCIVAQGDSVESVASENGYFWRTLWDHPRNAELKQLRQNPHVLYPADKLFVPPLREKEESRSTDSKHRFRRKGVPSKLKIVVTENDQPRGNEPYRLEIDGTSIEGVTGADGSVEQPIPPNAR